MPVHRGQTEQEDTDFHEAPFCIYHDLRMVLRSGGDGEFWGCIMYPDCKYTQPYEEDVGSTDSWWLH